MSSRKAPSPGCARRWTRARVNGGVFLGLNGIVVKSHGGTDDEGFAAAIELGYDMVRNRLLAADQGRSRQFPFTPADRGGKPAEPARDAGRAGLEVSMVIRSVVRGIGSALPSRIMKNTDFEGIVETSDEWIVAAHRHPPAPYRRRGRDDGLARRGGGARGARQCRPDACRHRPHRAGDLDARQHLSGDRRRDPAAARHAPRLRLRHAGGLLAASSMRVNDRRPAYHAAARPSACW